MPKPIPQSTRETEAFWESANRGKLIFQRCHVCGKGQFYPRFFCIHCGSKDLSWEEAKSGKVYSFTVIHRPPSEAFANDVPYILALVEFEGGVRVMANLKGAVTSKIYIGMPIQVKFEARGEKISVPIFMPV